jgi:hypothetical protein
MKTIFDNLINGNLSTAKRQANPFNVSYLAKRFHDFGMSAIQAVKAARYLKGLGTFQDYADAK